MRLSANTSWFNFSVQGMERPPSFAVYSFTGRETVSAPFEFTIELVSTSSSIDMPSLLGKRALLTIADKSGATRPVHGYIRQIEQLHTATRFTHYRCELVPRFWFLGKNSDHRIFQGKSVIEIIETILKEQMFTEKDFSFKCFNKYEPREYCVQYSESDLHFISRLCEEEGIFFYFDHSEEAHCMCFCDMPGGPSIPGESELRYLPGPGMLEETAVINQLRVRHSINSDAAEYREWNFTHPRLDLTVNQTGYPKAPAPAGLDMQNYKYPHLYQLQTPGKRYADLQVLRQRTFNQWIEGTSDVSRLLPSFTFKVTGHSCKDVNEKGWWVTSTYHSGDQPQALEQDAPDRGMRYTSAFTAIPDNVRFVPELMHPKTLIHGQQTALVTGPEGEEIYPDQYGRVKVQFFWDREGQGNELTSCWIRVSQGWAGGQYGSVALPRVGHEVIVSFLEGNPDRPLITGRVYHALNMPPYALPEHKTRMAIRSKTHKGDGYNELRFEDMKGNEQVFIHGQRDQDIIIENDSREWVKGNEHMLVEKDHVEEIKGISSTQAAKDRMEATGEKRTVTIGGDEAHQTGGSYHLKVNNNVFMEGMTCGVVEMHQELTLKAPGGFIHIDGTGITIEGKVVNINTGGSPGTGFPVQAIPARNAEVADSREAESGKAGTAVRAQALTAAPQAAPESTKAPLDKFGEDFAAAPVPGITPRSSAAALPESLSGAAPALSIMHDAPIDMEQLKTSNDPMAAEWRKTVLDARQDSSVSCKMETVNSFVQKNVAVTPGSAEKAQSPATLLQSGQGNSLECATAKFYTLHQAGVPADSMRVVSTDQGAYLLVHDGQQVLAAGSDFTPGMPMVRNVASLAPDIKPVLGFDANSLFTYMPV